MKQAILIFALSVILFSCSNKTASISHSRSDTMKTLMLYREDSIVKVELGIRIIKDSFKFASVDSTTQTKQWVKDTLYFVPVVIQTKGIADPKHPGKDTTTLNDRVVFIPWPKEFILIDGGKNVDSLFKKYKLRFPAAIPPASDKTKEHKS